MSDSRLVTPDLIEDLAVEVLKARHVEHLAKAERARGLAPRTLEPLKTVSHMAAQDVRLSGDKLPAVLVGFIGLAGTPVRNELDTLDAELLLGVQVSVIGPKRRDTLRRRDITAWTVAECLLERMPRDELVARVSWTDAEPVEEEDTQRILGEMRMVFSVGIESMVAIAGGLPPHNTDWPAGGPNGPPEGPYDEPDGPPQATVFNTTILKESVVD